MSKTQKFIVTILVISVLFTILCFPVSANNVVSMYDFGLQYTTSTAVDSALNTAESGITITAYTLYPYWALETYNEDYTYTCTFSFLTSTNLQIANNTLKAKFSQNNNSHTPGTFGDSSALTKVNIEDIGDSQGTKKVTITVKFNPKYQNLTYYPVYIKAKIGLSQKTTFETHGWGTSAEYDPGGEGYVQDVVDAVNQIKNDNATYHSNALEVLNQIKQNSDQLPDNIRQILNERDQSEKQEGQTQTEEGITSITDSLTNVIPVNSIIDSIKPLYNACTYEGTQSLWTLPGISIPQIAGVIEETQISTDTQFDMVQFADQYIPDSLLSLIRSVNGTGIIVFSVYEVISLINQVITGNFKEKESVEL